MSAAQVICGIIWAAIPYVEDEDDVPAAVKEFMDWVFADKTLYRSAVAAGQQAEEDAS